MRKLFVYCMLLSLLLSCKKYEEGPFISFRSKEERLANTWKVAKYFENGVDKTNDFNNVFNGYAMTINKDNSYSLSYKLFSLMPYSESGTWFFNTDKTSVTFKKNNSSSTWKILKLYEEELWGEFVDSNKIIQIHLIPL
ncbi:MAG: hypothetical protein N2449_02335 [Bacteroidales bacterium]|nr:hypothetical protein [Bacteroidales bacterium]